MLTECLSQIPSNIFEAGELVANLRLKAKQEAERLDYKLAHNADDPSGEKQNAEFRDTRTTPNVEVRGEALSRSVPWNDGLGVLRRTI